MGISISTQNPLFQSQSQQLGSVSSDRLKAKVSERRYKTKVGLEGKPYRFHKSKKKRDRVKAIIYFADNNMHRKMNNLLHSFDSCACIKHMLYLKGKKSLKFTFENWLDSQSMYFVAVILFCILFISQPMCQSILLFTTGLELIIFKTIAPIPV